MDVIIYTSTPNYIQVKSQELSELLEYIDWNPFFQVSKTLWVLAYLGEHFDTNIV